MFTISRSPERRSGGTTKSALTQIARRKWAYRHLPLRTRSSSGWAAGALYYDSELEAHRHSRAAPTRQALVSLLGLNGVASWRSPPRRPRGQKLSAEHSVTELSIPRCGEFPFNNWKQRRG